MILWKCDQSSRAGVQGRMGTSQPRFYSHLHPVRAHCHVPHCPVPGRSALPCSTLQLRAIHKWFSIGLGTCPRPGVSQEASWKPEPSLALHDKGVPRSETGTSEWQLDLLGGGSLGRTLSDRVSFCKAPPPPPLMPVEKSTNQRSVIQFF